MNLNVQQPPSSLLPHPKMLHEDSFWYLTHYLSFNYFDNNKTFYLLFSGQGARFQKLFSIIRACTQLNILKMDSYFIY